MSGAAYAALSGAGFGLFQALNGRAVRGLREIYFSTFAQVLAAAAVLGVAAVAFEDLSRLGDAPVAGVVLFVLAGLSHFFVGWTTLNLSQKRIGAARTGPLLSTTPLFGLVLAVLVADQLPNGFAIIGIALMVFGAYLVAAPHRGRVGLHDSGFAFATAAAWAVSAVLILEGLEHLDSPLFAVTLGMLASAVAYGALLVAMPWTRPGRGDTSRLGWKLAAGLVVAVATWGRWAALEDAAVAVVLALNLVSVPVVLLIAPLVSGRDIEVVTARLWTGAGFVSAGSLLLILQP